MSKKVLSLVLALVMVLGSISFVSAASFTDVTGESADAVDRLSLLGILEGYPDGTFKPEGQITRAEFAAVAVRAKGLASAAAAAQGLPTGFSDVPANNWASGVVGTAARLGIVNGVGNGQFAPQSPVKYEDAITMLVRALGYEESAKAKGGYPYGYLIVGNEIGLLDEVKGTQGAPATRGIVAQLTDNALEIEMMVQVGYGTETKWVVSGTEDTDEKYLLDELGFESVKGRTTNVSSSRKNITVTVEDEDEIDRLGKSKVSINLPAGFDVYEVEGLETKFWYKDGLVIAKVQEEAKFDAFEYNEDDEELDLITEDDSYEIAASKDLYDITIDDDNYKDINDGDAADYAKIVLNDDDEIIWAQGYTFDGFLVVEEVKDEVVYGVDDYDEVDVEDFLIVKDGKEISAEDLEEGDVLYYNDDEEFAVVSNKNITGEIERVYASADQVKFAGKTYDIADDAIYLTENGKVDDLDQDILDELKEEEEEVTMYFNFKNEIVLALAGDIDGSSDYYVITGNSNAYKGRGGWMVSLDVRNSAGEKLALDLDVDFVDPSEDGDLKVQDDFDGSEDTYKSKSGKTDEAYMNELADELTKSKVVEITLDKDGDPTEVVIMKGVDLGENSKVETDDSKVKVAGYDYKLKSNTVIFYDSTKKAILFGAAEEEFDEVEEPTLYAVDGDIVAIVGDTDTDTSTVSGVLLKTSNVKLDKNGYLEFTLNVNGKKTTYETEDDDYDMPSLTKGDVIDLEVSDSTGKVDSFSFAKNDSDRFVEGKITKVNGKNITLESGAKFELISGGVVYDEDIETIRLADLEGKTATLYRDGTHARYVQYVFAGETDGAPADTGVVTYINDTRLFVGEDRYTLDADTVLFAADEETILAVGGEDINVLVDVDDIVDITEVKDGVVVEMVLVEDASEKATADYAAQKAAAEKAAAELLNEAKDALAAGVTQADIDAAQALVAALKVADRATAQADINAAQGFQDALDYAALVEDAEEVAAALLNEAKDALAAGVTQADIDAAQDLVDEVEANDLFTAGDSDDAQADIDAAQDLLDLAEAVGAAEEALDSAKAARLAHIVNGGANNEPEFEAVLAAEADLQTAIESEVTADILTATQDLLDAIEALAE